MGLAVVCRVFVHINVGFKDACISQNYKNRGPLITTQIILMKNFEEDQTDLIIGSLRPRGTGW